MRQHIGPLQLGVHMGRCKLPLVAVHLEALAISAIQVFK